MAKPASATDRTMTGATRGRSISAVLISVALLILTAACGEDGSDTIARQDDTDATNTDPSASPTDTLAERQVVAGETTFLLVGVPRDERGLITSVVSVDEDGTRSSEPVLVADDRKVFNPSAVWLPTGGWFVVASSCHPTDGGCESPHPIGLSIDERGEAQGEPILLGDHPEATYEAIGVVDDRVAILLGRLSEPGSVAARQDVPPFLAVDTDTGSATPIAWQPPPLGEPAPSEDLGVSRSICAAGGSIWVLDGVRGADGTWRTTLSSVGTAPGANDASMPLQLGANEAPGKLVCTPGDGVLIHTQDRSATTLLTHELGEDGTLSEPRTVDLPAPLVWLSTSPRSLLALSATLIPAEEAITSRAAVFDVAGAQWRELDVSVPALTAWLSGDGRTLLWDDAQTGELAGEVIG